MHRSRIRSRNVVQSAAVPTAVRIPTRYSTQTRPQRSGFNLVELVVVIAVLVILAGLLLPSVTRVSREGARRTDCANRLRQVTLSTHNYHDIFKQFPSAMGDTNLIAISGDQGAERLTGLLLLLPYLDYESLFEEITSSQTVEGYVFPPLPAPRHSNYPAWMKQLPDLQCPSSPRADSPFGQSNYAFCIGDVAREIHRTDYLRGAFAPRLNSSLQDLPDGTSNTIAFFCRNGGAL